MYILTKQLNGTCKWAYVLYTKHLQFRLAILAVLPYTDVFLQRLWPWEKGIHCILARIIGIQKEKSG